MPWSDKQIQDLLIALNKLVSAAETTAIGKRTYKPHYYKITGPTPGTIPAGVKSFHIINLGLNGNKAVFADIPVTGITGTTEISKHVTIFGYKVENDQNILDTAITVTPPASHVVILQYLV